MLRYPVKPLLAGPARHAAGDEGTVAGAGLWHLILYLKSKTAKAKK